MHFSADSLSAFTCIIPLCIVTGSVRTSGRARSVLACFVKAAADVTASASYLDTGDAVRVMHRFATVAAVHACPSEVCFFFFQLSTKKFASFSFSFQLSACSFFISDLSSCTVLFPQRNPYFFFSWTKSIFSSLTQVVFILVFLPYLCSAGACSLFSHSSVSQSAHLMSSCLPFLFFTVGPFNVSSPLLVLSAEVH